MKTCRTCTQEKKYSEFPRDKYTKDGYTASCKKCRYEKSNQWHKKNYLKNKEEILKYNSRWRKKNWENVYKQRKESGYCKRAKKKWYHNKGKHNTNWVISERLRRRVRRVLDGNRKSNFTLELLGCSLDFLKNYLESKFYANMSWDNYGSYWHIDHIRPCASFNLQNEEDQKICFHYSNLQPLTAKENLQKGTKFFINNINKL